MNYRDAMSCLRRDGYDFHDAKVSLAGLYVQFEPWERESQFLFLLGYSNDRMMHRFGYEAGLAAIVIREEILSMEGMRPHSAQADKVDQ